MSETSPGAAEGTNEGQQAADGAGTQMGDPQQPLTVSGAEEGAQQDAGADTAPSEPAFPDFIRFEAGHAEHFVTWLHDWFEWKLDQVRRGWASH